jgi:KDO2-lipid IV(A) lauroyltransferase
MFIGVFIPHSFIALSNIKKAFPEFGFLKRLLILIKMWNNIGRVFAEFLFFNNKELKNLYKYFHIDEKSKENLLKIKGNKDGVFVFLAHFGQWNFVTQIAWFYDLSFSIMYRKMNNEYANKIMKKYYDKSLLKMIDKKDNGIIKLVKTIKKKENVFLLLDQRDSNGIYAPLFSIPSKTSTTLANFALKHDYKVYSLVIYRRHFYSVFFDIVVEEFDIKNTGNYEQDVLNNTISMNKKFEEWIKNRPEQWFWVHKRWKTD